MAVDKWRILQYRLNSVFAQKAFEICRSNKLEPILIKGFSLAAFYPNPWQRSFSDTDLAFSSADYPKAQQILRSGEFTQMAFDIHRELRHLDSVSWNELFDRSEFLDLDSTKIRVLCPEDLLRVTCVHWLTNGGEDREKLWDVYHIINNRRPEFDWETCLNSVSQNRKRWIICTIGLAHKFLGLDLSGTPIKPEATDLPKWLTRRVEKEWTSGIRLMEFRDAKRLGYKTFVQQMWKRFPPNPITATINCEGDLDARTRIFYQIRDIFKRLIARNTRRKIS